MKKELFKDFKLRTRGWGWDEYGEYRTRKNALRRASVLNRAGFDAKIVQTDSPSVSRGKRVEYFLEKRDAEGKSPILLLIEREKPKEKRSAENKLKMTQLDSKISKQRPKLKRKPGHRRARSQARKLRRQGGVGVLL